MNTSLTSTLAASALLVSTCAAEAFYNPTTGKWLCRDPIAEKGGVNPYGFVQNSPTIRRDYLGLTFLWVYPWMYTLIEPIHPPGEDADTWGSTTWYYFSPHARPYPSPYCPSCQYKINVSGSTQVVAWWVRGDKETERHEKTHVFVHYRNAYLAFTEESEYHAQTCMSQARAACKSAVIEGEMRAAYMEQPHATGKEFDCFEYGAEDPDVCRQAAEAAERWRLALQRLQAALDRCEAIP